MIKFEYRTLIRYVGSEREFQSSLDAMGNAGWELVTVTPETEECESEWIFKRVKND